MCALSSADTLMKYANGRLAVGHCTNVVDFDLDAHRRGLDFENSRGS